MKIRASLLVAGLAVVPLAWAAAAQAQELPDLPGMGAASKLVGGQATATDETDASQKDGTTQSVVTTEGAADSKAETDATPSLPDLPGLGMLPAIKAEKAKASLPVSGAGLEAWAALGTVAAVGGLYALRRYGVI